MMGRFFYATEGILTGLMLFVYSDEINFMKIAFSDPMPSPFLVWMNHAKFPGMGNLRGSYPTGPQVR